jgi:hypothetical protein
MLSELSIKGLSVVPLGLKVDISLKKIADWEMQMY